MMKKFLFLLLIATTTLVSCGDDDKPVIPQLNKLTKITCYVDDNEIPDSELTIYYTTDGKIQGTLLNGKKNLFIYSNNTLTISDNSFETTEFTLSGNTITKAKYSKENKYVNNEIYVSDEYTYRYSGSNLSYIDWKYQRPKQDGTGYDSGEYREDDIFKWEGGNISQYTKDKSGMGYEYSATKRPVNFPLRLSCSFTPVGLDVVSPINLMFGNLGKNLPERAYLYQIPETSNVLAEYTYNYVTDGDYVKGMIVEEKKNTAEGLINKVYKYSFEYGFKM